LDFPESLDSFLIGLLLSALDFPEFGFSSLPFSGLLFSDFPFSALLGWTLPSVGLPLVCFALSWLPLSNLPFSGFPLSVLLFSEMFFEVLLASILGFVFLSVFDASALLECGFASTFVSTDFGVALFGDLVSLETVSLVAGALEAVGLATDPLAAGASGCSGEAFDALARGSDFLTSGTWVPAGFAGAGFADETFEPFDFESPACSSGLGLVL